MDCGFFLPVCNRTPGRLSVCWVSCPTCCSVWEVFRLWCSWPSYPVCKRTSGMPSSWSVFSRTDKLANSCSVAPGCSRSPGMPVALCAKDLLGCFTMWCLQGNKLASSLSWQKRPGEKRVELGRQGFWYEIIKYNCRIPLPVIGETTRMIFMMEVNIKPVCVLP